MSNVENPPGRDFCLTDASRATWPRYEKHSWPVPPPLDETGLKASIGQLDQVAVDREMLAAALLRITDTFLWPATALALIVADKRLRNAALTQCALPMQYSLEEFQLDDKKSISRYSIESGRDFFVADTGIHSKVVSFYAMQGKPIQDALGDFPGYTHNDKIEDQLNTAVLTKDVDLVHQAVMLSLKTRSHRGLLLVGFSATAFSNGAYPLTKFDRAWFYVVMKPQIEAVLGRLS